MHYIQHKVFSLSFILLLLCSAMTHASESSTTSTAAIPGTDDNWLISIGVTRFKDATLSPLKFCASDAQAIYDFFTSSGYVPPAQAQLLVTDGPKGSRPPTRTEILKVINYVTTTAGPESTIIISFSGHGFSDENGQDSYLMPEDGEVAVMRDTAVPLSRINEMLRQSKSKRKILLVDACRNAARTDTKGSSETKATAAFIDSLKSGAGQITLNSCAIGQSSYEMPDDQHGVFTHYLLEGLRGAAPADASGFITLSSLHSYIASSVPGWCRANLKPIQEPWMDGNIGMPIPIAVKGSSAAAPDPLTEFIAKPAGDRSIVLQWDENVPKGAKLVVDRIEFDTEAGAGSGSRARLQVDAATHRYSDTAVDPDKSYVYVAMVEKGGARSDEKRTQPVMTKPSPPPPPKVERATERQVALKWDAIGSKSARLHIKRSTDAADGKYVALVEGGLPVDRTTYTDGDLSPGKTYWYKLQLENEAGYSGESPPLEAKTEGTAQLETTPAPSTDTQAAATPAITGELKVTGGDNEAPPIHLKPQPEPTSVGEQWSSAELTKVPEQGSATRNAIMDTIREPLQEHYRRRIIFQVDDIRMGGNRAEVLVRCLEPETGKIEGAPYDDIPPILARVEKTGGRWHMAAWRAGTGGWTGTDYAGSDAAPVAPPDSAHGSDDFDLGSSGRVAVMNALRGPLQQALNRKIIFETVSFKISGSTAYVVVRCLEPVKGKTEGVPYGDIPPIAATLVRTSGGWAVQNWEKRR